VPGARAISVIIVGAGFGGIAAAIELRRHGFSEVTVLERAAGLGGTWHYNDYPGCACDVPSHLYSFSFDQRRHWSRICSPREEILAYLEDVAREQGADRLIEFGVEVTACRWMGVAGRQTRWFSPPGSYINHHSRRSPVASRDTAFTRRGGTTRTRCGGSEWR